MKYQVYNWHHQKAVTDKLIELGYDLREKGISTELMDLAPEKIMELSEHFSVCLIRNEKDLSYRTVGVTLHRNFGQC